MVTEDNSLAWVPLDKSFMPLVIPTKEPKNNHNGWYRVYKNEKEFVEIDAFSLSDAMEKSGVESPHKIQRIVEGTHTVFAPGTLKKTSGYGSEARMQHIMNQSKAKQILEDKQSPEDTLPSEPEPINPVAPPETVDEAKEDVEKVDSAGQEEDD